MMDFLHRICSVQYRLSHSIDTVVVHLDSCVSGTKLCQLETGGGLIMTLNYFVHHCTNVVQDVVL